MSLVAASLERAPMSVGILADWDQAATQLQSMLMMVAVVSLLRPSRSRSRAAQTACRFWFARRLASTARLKLRRRARRRSPRALPREHRRFPRPITGAFRLARSLVVRVRLRLP